jgi:hypothetical protein
MRTPNKYMRGILRGLGGLGGFGVLYYFITPPTPRIVNTPQGCHTYY